MQFGHTVRCSFSPQLTTWPAVLLPQLLAWERHSRSPQMPTLLVFLPTGSLLLRQICWVRRESDGSFLQMLEVLELRESFGFAGNTQDQALWSSANRSVANNRPTHCEVFCFTHRKPVQKTGNSCPKQTLLVYKTSWPLRETCQAGKAKTTAAAAAAAAAG
jgi:hypothetical protein